jgi:regulator of sigma E protease
MSPFFLILAIIIGLLVLSILVFVHELGHFLAAKACKIRVNAFALGFGKALFKWTRGETEYRVNAIPFGGYVAMADGDNPVGETMGGGAKNGSADENDFNSKPIWQRAAVALAGPVANFVFAIITLWVVFIHGVDRPAYMDSSAIGVVIADSPADSAGFLAGDSVVAINGEAVGSWEQVESRLAQQLDSYLITVLRGGEFMELELRIEKFGARLPKNPTGGLLPARYPPVIGGIMPKSSAETAGLNVGDTILSINGTEVASFDRFAAIMRKYDPEGGPASLSIKRGGETMNVLVIPAFDSAQNRYLLGVEPAAGPTKLVRYGPIAAIGPTMAKTWEYTVMIFDVLGKLTSGKVSAKQLAGPLNIIPVSGMMAFQGLSTILNFMALIGINLAVLNLLPLVITDGGLLMFLGIEAIRGRPLPAQAQAAINKVFIVLFLALFLFVSFNDIQRLPDFLRLWR